MPAGCPGLNYAYSVHNPDFVAWYTVEVVPAILKSLGSHPHRFPERLVPIVSSCLKQHRQRLNNLGLWTEQVAELCS